MEKTDHAQDVRNFFRNRFLHLEAEKATLEDFYYIFCRSSFYVYDDLKQLVEVFFETFNKFEKEEEIVTKDFLLISRILSGCPELEDENFERLPSQKNVGFQIGMQMDLFFVKHEKQVSYFTFSIINTKDADFLMNFTFKAV